VGTGLGVEEEVGLGVVDGLGVVVGVGVGFDEDFSVDLMVVDLGGQGLQEEYGFLVDVTLLDEADLLAEEEIGNLELVLMTMTLEEAVELAILELDQIDVREMMDEG
jgi:hypothetical protein